MAKLTPTQALLGMARMIFDQLPQKRQQELLDDPAMMAEFIKIVRQEAKDIRVGAKLNDMTLDEFMIARARMGKPKGNA